MTQTKMSQPWPAFLTSSNNFRKYHEMVAAVEIRFTFTLRELAENENLVKWWECLLDLHQVS